MRAKHATPITRSSGVVIPHRAKWHQRLAAALTYATVHGVAATVRFELDDPVGLFRAGPPDERLIFAIWHNRLALSPIMYRRYVAVSKEQRNLAAMVSASRDGGLLASILKRFGVQPVRGSSSRRGAQAVREMISWGERGYDLAITPDGPRGPRYQVQDGVVSVGQLSGLPIVPVSCHLDRKIQIKSWDQFQVPLPFARCRLRIGEVLRVPADAGDSERERLRQKLEQTLIAITQD